MKPNIKILLKAIGIAILTLGGVCGYVFGLWALGEIWVCIGMLLFAFCSLVFAAYHHLKYEQKTNR